MKKAIRTLTILALIFGILGGVCYLLTPLLARWMNEAAVSAIYGNLRTYFLAPAYIVIGWFDFSNVITSQIVGLVCLGVMAIVAIVWFILFCVKRKGKSFFVWIVTVGVVAVTFYIAIHYYLYRIDNVRLYQVLMNTVPESATSGNVFPIIHRILFWATIGLVGLAFIFTFLAFIIDLIYICAGKPAGKRRVYASADDDHLVLVRDAPAPAGPSSQEIRELLHEELSSLDKGEVAPQAAPAPAAAYQQAPAAAPAPQYIPVSAGQSSAISGPLLVQYINTYGPQGGQPAPQQHAPAPYPYPPYPPYPYPPYPGYHCHGPQKEEKKEELTIEAIRAAMSENLAQPKEEPAPQPEPEPAPQDEHYITLEDIRNIVAQEVGRIQVVEEEVEEPAPEHLSDDQIRSIIADEISKSEPEPEPAPAPVEEEEEEENSITLEDLRNLIAEELDKRNVYHIVEEVHEVPAPQPEPEPEPEPAPQPEPEPEPEPEPAPAPEPAPEPVVVEPVEAESEAAKIVRIPFDQRMKEADRDLKNRYNELKSELLSYGLNSRVSNSGDTFRLHRKTYCKITIAGKNLKLYMALDPADYANTTLPISDAGHKGAYAEIPLVFKVKSDLSMRRAKQLIADCLAKDGVPQGKVEPHNWANELTVEEEDN